MVEILVILVVVDVVLWLINNTYVPMAPLRDDASGEVD